MASALEDLLIRIDASTEPLRREMTRADQSVSGFAANVDRSVERAAQRLGMLGQHARQAGGQAAGGIGLASHQITNLGYQLQDVVVQLAGGANPFLVLMQQGPQAAAAVGGFNASLTLLATVAKSAAAALFTMRGILIGSGVGIAVTAVLELVNMLAEAEKQAKAFTERMKEIDQGLDANAKKLHDSAEGYRDLTAAQRDALDVRQHEQYREALKRIGDDAKLAGQKIAEALGNNPQLSGADRGQGFLFRVKDEMERLPAVFEEVARSLDFVGFDRLLEQYRDVINSSPEVAAAVTKLRGAMDDTALALPGVRAGLNAVQGAIEGLGEAWERTKNRFANSSNFAAEAMKQLRELGLAAASLPDWLVKIISGMGGEKAVQRLGENSDSLRIDRQPGGRRGSDRNESNLTNRSQWSMGDEQERRQAVTAVREQIELQALARRAELAEANGASGVAASLRRDIALREERNRLIEQAAVLYAGDADAQAAWVESQARAFEQHYDLVAEGEKARKALSVIEGYATRAFDRIGSAITQAFTQGRMSIEDLGNIGKAVLSELMQMFLELALINPIKNSLGLGGGDLPTFVTVLQGIAGIAGAFAGGLGNLSMNMSNLSKTMHTGGIVGRDFSGTRTVDMSLFAGAPRMHSGGLAGDEMPAILQKGELVVPRDRVAQAMGENRPVFAPVNTIHIAGNGVTEAQVRRALEENNRALNQQLERGWGTRQSRFNALRG